MQEYDVALKTLLKGSAALTVRALTGTAVAKWLDVELPKVRKVQNLRLDLLGQTAGGQLIHIELQSGNDAAMPFRMIEYCLGIQRLFGQFPRQILLYVGEAPMHMQNELRGPDLSFQYGLIDIRTLDGLADLVVVVRGHVQHLVRVRIYGRLRIHHVDGMVVGDLSIQRPPQREHHGRAAHHTDSNGTLCRTLQPFRVPDEGQHGSRPQLILGFGSANCERKASQQADPPGADPPPRDA